MRSLNFSRTCLLAVAAMVLAACTDSPMNVEKAQEGADELFPAEGASVFNQELAKLRRATAPFHRLEAAMAAGWDFQLTPCLEDPVLGAQGFHYADLSLIDGTVNLTEPELLQYEPQGNGFRLVGVEYIVPFAFVPSTDPAPSLLGQDFHANMAAGIWALHVWLWRHNPSGMFADWNPKVSC